MNRIEWNVRFRKYLSNQFERCFRSWSSSTAFPIVSIQNYQYCFFFFFIFSSSSTQASNVRTKTEVQMEYTLLTVIIWSIRWTIMAIWTWSPWSSIPQIVGLIAFHMHHFSIRFCFYCINSMSNNFYARSYQTIWKKYREL